MTMIHGKKNIEKWWAENPMTYSWETHGTTTYRHEEGYKTVDFKSKSFFEEADRVFIEWNKPLHQGGDPFSVIFPFGEFKGKKVLEVGCGMGLMASLWATHGASISAVDLNPVAVDQTKRRFDLWNLSGEIRKEDGNTLSFENDTFDYVYSWGVLHHSPNLSTSISELMRVLKPGGRFGIMLYNRHSLLYWYHVLFVEGWLHRERQFLNSLELASRYGDGAREEGNPHTWPVTRRELKRMFAPYVGHYNDRLLGTDLDSVFLQMLPGLSFILPAGIKKLWARRFGWSIWAWGEKGTS